MATCQSYNCLDLPAYDETLDNCALYRKGGISQIVLLACGVQMADPSDQAELEALIAGNEAWYMANLKVGLDAPSPETVDPITSCGTARTVNNVYTGTLFDAKVSEANTTFYNQLIAGYAIGGALLRVCDTDGLAAMMIYVNAEIAFSGGLVVSDTNSELIRYELNFTFKTNSLETIAANPYFG